MKILRLILALSLLFMLCACTESEQQEPQPPQDFSEVYNDGVIAVETKRLIKLPGSDPNSEYCYLEVRLANNGTMPVYYSSMLCISVSSEGKEFSNQNVVDAANSARNSIEGFSTLDGVIDAGTTAQGFVIFEAPVGVEQFDIRLATDFCGDEWISFSCGVS